MRLLRPLAVLVVVLALGASQIQAAGARRDSGQAVAQRAVSLLDRLGAFLGWTKAGCRIDPLGRCIPEPTTKAGCRLDPFGHCITEPTTKEGCRIDPFG